MKHILIIGCSLILFLTAYTVIKPVKQEFGRQAYEGAMAKKGLGTSAACPIGACIT